MLSAVDFIVAYETIRFAAFTAKSDASLFSAELPPVLPLAVFAIALLSESR